ncbi:GxGYxYP domain-containing protein [Actinopolymorpha singaporensis]
MTEARSGISRRQAMSRMAWAGAGVLGLGAVDLARPPSAQAAGGSRSLFPKGVRPTRLHAVREGALSPAERVLVATLQGQLARPRPYSGTEGIYVDVPGVGYPVWLADLADRYDVEVVEAAGAWELVDRFARPGTAGRTLDRYVLYRDGDGSVNVATSVAGLLGAVAVEESLEPSARAHRMRRVLDVRGRDDHWVKNTFWNRLRHDVAIEQKADFANQLRDYATMAGAFVFFDGNSDFRAEVVGDLDPDAAVIGWGDASKGEDAFVSVSSRAGVRTIAADHARNLAPLSGITLDSVRQHPLDEVPAPPQGTHHVAFLVTDGDNVQWLLGDFQSDRRWYGSPSRGSLDLGWAVAPGLVDLAPSVLRWYYDHAADGEHRDRFVVGPSGGGYLYPSRYPRADLDLHTDRLAGQMRRADLGVVQILDFESMDDTSLWSSYLRHDQIEGLVYLEYSRYDAGRGRVVWVNDKPVVAPRAMLWQGLSGADEASVAATVNDAGRDPTSVDAYSLVIWHAWSKSVDDVRSVVNQLAPHVRVVTPDVLVRMMAANVHR